MVSVPGSSIDNAAVDGRGGLELRKSGGRAAPAPPAAAPSTSGGEGQGTDAASMIINSEMEALRRQRMLAAAYEAQVTQEVMFTVESFFVKLQYR